MIGHATCGLGRFGPPLLRAERLRRSRLVVEEADLAEVIARPEHRLGLPADDDGRGASAMTKKASIRAPRSPSRVIDAPSGNVCSFRRPASRTSSGSARPAKRAPSRGSRPDRHGRDQTPVRPARLRSAADDEIQDRADHREDDHDQDPGCELSAAEALSATDDVDDRDEPRDDRRGADPPEPARVRPSPSRDAPPSRGDYDRSTAAHSREDPPRARPALVDDL